MSGYIDDYELEPNFITMETSTLSSGDSELMFYDMYDKNNDTSLLRTSPYSNSDFNMTFTPWLLLTPLSVTWKVAYVILAIMIVSTNFIIIVIFLYSKRSRKQMGLFLLNLGIVDLQNGLLSIPFLIFFPRSKLLSPTEISPASCILLVTWPQILYTVAYQSVFLVTIERFISVSRPFMYDKLLQKKRIGLMIVLGVWVLAIVVSLVPTYNYNINPTESKLTLCQGKYKAGVLYLQLFLLVMIVTPFIINLVLYILMYRVAKKHLNTVRQQRAQANKENRIKLKTIKQKKVLDGDKPLKYSASTCSLRGLKRNGSSNGSLLGHFKRSLQASFKRRQIVRASKAAKTTCLLSAFYVISWLPFILLIQINSLCTVKYCRESYNGKLLQTALPYAMFLAFLGSAVNPIIYILRNSIVKLEMKNIVFRNIAKLESSTFSSTIHRKNSTLSVPTSNVKKHNVSFQE